MNTDQAAARETVHSKDAPTTLSAKPSIVRNGIICACLVAAAILISWPVAEMGFIDDWSYVKTALVFAQTGHIAYNGWATAMLGWTIPWGALFIKLFGFSFTAVRFSTLPVAMASVFLFHSSLARFGISSRNAVVGALTLGLSPLFLPLAASYMTDISGLFCIVLCLYLCQRALAAQSAGSTILWLICAALTNIVGGTVRQIAWLGALVMVPSTAWLLRKRADVPGAVLLWIISLTSVLGFMRWFDQQPYSLPERILQGPVTGMMLPHMLAELLKALLCLALVSLPVLSAWFGTSRELSRSALIRIVFLLTALAGASLVLGTRGELEHRVMPWLGHVIGTQSIFPSTGEMLGSRPVTLTMPLRVVLSLAVIAAVLMFAEHLATRPWQRKRPGPDSLYQALGILGPFGVSYVAFLLPRALYSLLYDRYLLALMPVAIVILLLLHQRWVADRLPTVAIWLLALFALYTVAGTHDWFALNRTRAATVAEIHASGVPLTSIEGGFDYDGWTQLQAAGYINDDRLRNPADSYHPNLDPLKRAPACRLNFAPFTPAITPKYFVVFKPMACLEPSAYPPVRYRTWLPPFQREIYIQQAKRE